MGVRVLGGSARGRRIRSVPGASTRPPLARVRQAVFNILQPITPGARWLDLFAGTGSYGVEALSRGAEAVVMVELDPKAVRIIRQNLETTGLAARATVIRGDVLQELPRLAANKARFNVIGVAPPYFRGLGPRVLDLIDRTGVLAPDGLVFVQRHRKEELPARAGALRLVREYTYGETVLSLYGQGDHPAGDA